MTDEDFRKLCNVYGFAPSRALREMLDCAVGQAAVKEFERQQALEALLMMRDRYGDENCPACDHADAAIKALRGRK